MNKYRLMITSIAALFVPTSSWATDLPCDVHSEMKLSSIAGTWHTQVQHLNEAGDIVMLDQGCKPINTIEPGTDISQNMQQVTAMNVTPDSTLVVGHQLGRSEDFDTSLLFSMVQVLDKGQTHDSPTKTCLFYVAAKGPAQPVTRIFELNGAKCTFINDIEHLTYKFNAE
ncbi:hypothetical protein D5R81_06795 [Parashewanella spongiae]|uniref:DUF1579 domain-containing protein n=1 Tax=Parashewanella spongiae TaxID=342950 RepID=A0A3A6TQ86_9GAMM|nr:hypothetical protein [Parashewanella spongiae]MCL1077628.1 hypothetical protein [Parashewanella spongiae]RJY18145.1 hypothetical protein D5R81_06795 [Parashewanella spongiae]